MNKDIVTFFGYGSLINKASLHETVPSILSITPSYIQGYRREFGVWDPEGFSGEGWHHTGEYALNVVKVASPHFRVNGVCITIPVTFEHELVAREDGYEEVYENVYDFFTKASTGVAEVFTARHDDNRFLFGSRDQEEYLKICLKGAASFGDAFYQEFLDTTYIGDKRLSEISSLKKVLDSI